MKLKRGLDSRVVGFLIRLNHLQSKLLTLTKSLSATQHTYVQQNLQEILLLWSFLLLLVVVELLLIERPQYVHFFLNRKIHLHPETGVSDSEALCSMMFFLLFVELLSGWLLEEQQKNRRRQTKTIQNYRSSSSSSHNQQLAAAEHREWERKL